eukprot:TRINITY_DN15069_c0_g2_i1.p1 TRINITY_DN15069_c0_g2~~TRINITY_DN15069_c0_g2_i1.p1  ORF type:complete len:117 (-),score=2.70 TRINITY_DN15069_c0_g2_i1:254-604(-)
MLDIPGSARVARSLSLYIYIHTHLSVHQNLQRQPGHPQARNGLACGAQLSRPMSSKHPLLCVSKNSQILTHPSFIGPWIDQVNRNDRDFDNFVALKSQKVTSHDQMITIFQSRGWP